jgi:hypothetical protein
VAGEAVEQDPGGLDQVAEMGLGDSGHALEQQVLEEVGEAGPALRLEPEAGPVEDVRADGG